MSEQLLIPEDFPGVITTDVLEAKWSAREHGWDFGR